MQQGEVAYVPLISNSRSIPTIEDLRSWDWRDELRRQERSFGWLARHTDRSPGAVARYASGTLDTPDSWLVAAARVLGVQLDFEVAAA